MMSCLLAPPSRSHRFSLTRRVASGSFGCAAILALVLVCALMTPARAQSSLVLADNMKVLQCDMPTTDYKFTGSNIPGQLFLPGDSVTLNFDFAKGADNGTVTDYSLELQEITTRDPNAHASGGETDTAGAAPLIGLAGKPIDVPLTVSFTSAPRATFTAANVPLPARYGTYAMVLKRGAKRTFMGTLARLPQPRADGTVDNVPIFGEGALDCLAHPGFYARMGVRGWRQEFGWNADANGNIDWSRDDQAFNSAKKYGCQIMCTMGGTPAWTRPFDDPTPAANWTPQTGGYGGTGDWLLRYDLYPKYGEWIKQFVARYWQGGEGGLWGIENYNEPWEGGGISGWASDAPTYIKLQKLIATSAKAVDPKFRVLGTCTVMNTEDKLYSKGDRDLDKYIDIFTDHYVPPVCCYDPQVAKMHGKQSMETETWFVNSEYTMPMGAVEFLASGQKRLSPWHPRVLFDTLPGNPDNYFIPTPVVVATAAFNQMVTGRPFEKMVFQDHLPFAFQFGKDDDKEALVIVFGHLLPIGQKNFKALIWAQVNSVPGGTMTIDNSDGLLKFYDLAGNPDHVGEKSVTLPLSYLPTYIKSDQGPAAIAKRLNEARLSPACFVEIVPHDFNTLPNAAGAVLHVELRNRLNRAVSGDLKVTPPDGLSLGKGDQPVSLNAGESKVFDFPVASATLSPSNSYPCKFDFTSADGNASYAENINAAVVSHKTMTIDGNLDAWADIPGVNAIGADVSGDVTEQLRRPWLELQKGNPAATSGELKMAWDENYLYVCAQVNDPTPEENAYRFGTRDENSYFHSAADDNISPYKEFIEAFRKSHNQPNASFGEVSYVYRKSPEPGIPFRRDRLQLAFDTTPGWHDLTPDTRVPQEFHAYPDTDYEYALFWVNDGQDGGGELWRELAPGVPRIHDWPHQPKGERTTGDVPGAKTFVKRTATGYIYEAAIPRAELAELKLAAGTEFGFTFKIGNSKGTAAAYGEDKAITKHNGLTMHPYWENGPNADTRWTLVQ